MRTLSSSTRQKHVNILQIILLFFMVRAAAIQHYGSYTLLDNEKPDLLYEIKPYGVWMMCNVKTTADYDTRTRINNKCYNNRNKKSSLKYAWYEAGSSGTGPPKCTPLHSGSEWVWTCERNLSPSEVTPYRNCTVVCKKGYIAMNHDVTARCSVNSQDELEWIWFGNTTEHYCQRIPVTGSPTLSVIPTDTTSTTTTRTNSVEATAIPGLDDGVVPKERSVNAENGTNKGIPQWLLILSGVGGGLAVMAVVIIIMIVLRIRLRNSNSRRTQSYSPVSSSQQVHGCCYRNPGSMSTSEKSPETSFSSSSETSSHSDSNEKNSKTGNQLDVAEPVSNDKDSTISETGDQVQITEPISNDKQVDTLYGKEVDYDSSGSEDSEKTRQEDTIRFDDEGSVGQLLMDIQENVTGHSVGLGDVDALSLTSLNNEEISTLLPSGIIVKRLDNDGLSVNDRLPAQSELKIKTKVDLPTAKDYTIVDLQTAPKMGSSIYSSKQSSNNRNSVTTKQLKDKVVAITTTCQLPMQDEVIEGAVCILLIKDIQDMVFLQKVGYYLDPDDNRAKSWYGLTLTVLKLSEETVKSIRHHSKGNVDNGHFMATVEYYTAQGKFLSDIVEYFIQEDTMRCDVVEFIKDYHGNCDRCNLLYSKVNMTHLSPNLIREASLQHHLNNTRDS